MKVIDLLNDFYKGIKPKRIKYDYHYYVYDESYNTYYQEMSGGNQLRFMPNELNDEVEILEEEKKIPEKLPYYSMEKIQKAKNKDEWREERITLLEKRVNDLHYKINEIIDYLKSKGE